MNNIFLDIGLIIVVATIFAYFTRIIKQPLIPAYILAGVAIGPILGLITNSDVITTLSEIGIAFLLFIVGLEIDLRKMRDVAKVSIMGGSLQVIILFTVGFVIAKLLGIFSSIEAVYLGLVIAFSSTMVVVKILSDNKQIDTLHGRIIIGILLIEDLYSMLALLVLATLSDFSIFILIMAIIKGLLLFAIALFSTKIILPNIFKTAAKSQELLFLVSLSVCFFFALLAKYIGKIFLFILQTPFFDALLTPSTEKILDPGFSIVFGAFIAGICLANLPYNIEIIGKVRPLKDFFATIFFVSLGLQLTLSAVLPVLKPVLIFTLVIILIKPFVITFIVSMHGYMRRPAFLTAISLTQVSEFALIIVAEGIILGHVSPHMFAMVVLITVITITCTSYFISYDYEIYRRISKYLKVFDNMSKHQKDDLEYIPKHISREAIVFGYDRIGYNIIKKLHIMKKNYIIVDYNPEIIKQLVKQKIPCIYGDAGDIEVLERINLHEAELVISTIPGDKESLLIIKKTKEVNEKAIIFVTAERVEEALSLYEAGADYVILPHFLGGERVALLIEDLSTDINRMLDHKLNHIRELHERKTMGHDHPTKA